MKDFLATFGRLPRTWTNLGLILAAGLTQGLGLSLFVPLLEFLTSETGERSAFFGHLARVYDAVGIPFALPYLLGGIVLLVWLGLLLNFAQRSLLGWSQTQFVWNMRTAFVSGLLRSNWAHLARQATGDNVNLLVSSIFRVGRGLANQVEAVACVIQVVVFLSFSALFSWQLLIAALIFGALAMLTVRPLQHLAVRFGDTLLRHEQRYGFVAVDYLKNLKLIKVTAAEQGVIDAIDNLHGNIARTAAAKICVLAATYFSSQGLAVLMCALVIGLAHGVLEISGAQTAVFLIFIIRCAPLLAQFQQNYQSYRSEAPAIDLFEKHRRAFAVHHEPENAGKAPVAGFKSDIRMDHLSFSYDGAEQGVLHDVDLTIRKGSMVAFVGESGAGKSTIIDLICGLRNPDSGRILVDGRDLRDLDPRSWRRRIGYVGQDVLVFNQTLRQNIVFAYPAATEAEIWEAINAAHLRQVISELPDGLDTVLGESGVRLSGGQRQRLALARALVAKPDLLLLDEATSALDNESELIVQKAIEGLARQLTIIIVAHRLSTVRKADPIFVVDKGRIVETGTFQELLRRQGRFSRLHEMQFMEAP